MSDDIQLILSGGFFSCPWCSKYFRWVDEYAGKKVRCRCGHTLTFPVEPKRGGSWALETTPEQAFSVTAEEEPQEAPPAAAAAVGPSEMASLDELDEEVLELPPELEIELPAGVDIEALMEQAEAEKKLAQENEPDVDLPDLDSGEYDVGADQLGRTKALHEGRCPQCRTPLKPAAVVCLECGYNIEAGKTLDTKLGTVTVKVHVEEKPKELDPVEPMKPEETKGVSLAALALSGHRKNITQAIDRRADEQDYAKTEYMIPIILVLVGIILIFFNALVLPSADQYTHSIPSAGNHKQRMAVLMLDGLVLLLQAPCLFAGIFIVAKYTGASFGPLTSAYVKLLAISVLTRGMRACFLTYLQYLTSGTVWLALPVVIIFEFAAFWILSARLFRMEFVEVMAMYALAFLGPLMILLVALAIMGKTLL